MQGNIDELVILIGIAVTLSVTYSSVMGPVQTHLAQALIDAFAVPSAYRALLNFGLGLGLALVLTAVGALALGTWGIVGIGVLAGILASVEAGKVHDQAGAYEAGVQTGIKEARQVLGRRHSGNRFVPQNDTDAR